MEEEKRKPKWKILTMTQLKLLAVVLMVFDHVRQMFIVDGTAIMPDWFGMLGRLVLPLFLFAAAEGMFYTHSRKKYMIQLLIGYEAMVVLNAVISRAMPSEAALINNVFGTLFMMALYIYLIDRLKDGFREDNWKKILSSLGLILLPVIIGFICLIGLGLLIEGRGAMSMGATQIAVTAITAIPNFFALEGGVFMAGLGAAFYYTRKWPYLQIASLIASSVYTFFLPGNEWQWMMVFAAVPILMYNGERGRGNKYFFYIFYPAHIYFLYILAWLIMQH
ncbi:MAG: conjugal transfer protein TraX [Clostridiales bacterium]|jgi:hypothetical protein|nr:conjugal transfer protein TraX [Clostridiales bacterium]